MGTCLPCSCWHGMSMSWECVFPGLLYSLGVGFPYPSLKFIPQGPGIPFLLFLIKKHVMAGFGFRAPLCMERRKHSRCPGSDTYLTRLRSDPQPWLPACLCRSTLPIYHWSLAPNAVSWGHFSPTSPRHADVRLTEIPQICNC